MVATFPTHSKVKSMPPSNFSCSTAWMGLSWSFGLMHSVAPNCLAVIFLVCVFVFLSCNWSKRKKIQQHTNRKLVWVDVNADNVLRTALLAAHHDCEADSAKAPHGHG